MLGPIQPHIQGVFIQSDFKVLLRDVDLTKPAPAVAQRQKVLDQHPDLHSF